MAEFDDLPDKDLISKLEDGGLAFRFETSDDWKLVKAACDRIVIQATDEILRTPADHTIRIVELQITIKFCRNILNSIITSIKEEGKLAFDEAKARGLLNKPTPPAAKTGKRVSTRKKEKV